MHQLFPNKKNLIFLFAIIFLGIVFQVYLIDKISYALPFLIVFNILLLSLIIYSFLLRSHLTIILIVLSLIPLVYLNLPFHYSLITIIIQDIPIFLLSVVTIIGLLSKIKSTVYSYSHLSLPILFLILYSFVMLFVGIRNGNPSYYIIEEFYHVMYYFLFFIYLNSLKNRNDYQNVFIAIIIVSIIFSFEFIFFNVVLGFRRFVTFQSYILPIIGTITFSLFLFNTQWNRKRIIVGIVSIIIQLGIFITLTRTLWAASFLSLSVLCVLYLRRVRGVSQFKITLLFIVFTIPLIYLGTQIKPKQQSEKNTDDVEYRSQSIANPGEDRSFLMRVELGLYIIEDFLNSPIVGHGFGASVKYKYLGITNKPIYYPDNSWLFFLWKGGIIGFLLFVFIYYKAIRISWKVSVVSQNLFVRRLMVGIFAGLIGLAILGLFNAVLIKYKTTFILPFILAYIEFEHRKILSRSDGIQE